MVENQKSKIDLVNDLPLSKLNFINLIVVYFLNLLLNYVICILLWESETISFIGGYAYMGLLISNPFINLFIYLFIYLFHKKYSLKTSVIKLLILIHSLLFVGLTIYLYIVGNECQSKFSFSLVNLFEGFFYTSLYIDIIYILFGLFPTLYIYDKFIKKIF